jgi:hypothetical protein
MGTLLYQLPTEPCPAAMSSCEYWLDLQAGDERQLHFPKNGDYISPPRDVVDCLSQAVKGGLDGNYGSAGEEVDAVVRRREIVVRCSGKGRNGQKDRQKIQGPEEAAK